MSRSANHRLTRNCRKGVVMKYYFLALGTLLFVCVGCAIDGQELVDNGEYHAPPASMMSRPGPMVDGPGPGVMPMIAPPDTRSFATETTQVRFVNPAGMQIGWQVDHGYAESQLTAPARYNFQQGATYRLKVANIANREGLVLYPSLQVYPSHPSTDAYLSHNSVPVEITDEDLDQVEANNFVSKVIYLPDAKFQELAIAGVETLVSTRLDPGVDPVTEADRRGTVMVVLRLGNMDLEVPQTYGGPAAGPAAQAPGMNGISQIGYEQTITLDGSKGQFRPPMPIAIDGAQQMRMPTATLMGAPGGPGQGSYNPMMPAASAPLWGQPMTGTPIGLPGPAALPLGGPATLQSHTIRNLSKYDIEKPKDYFLMDVKHKPGYSLPAPVNYVQYTEKHPSYSPGEVSFPAYSTPQQ